MKNKYYKFKSTLRFIAKRKMPVAFLALTGAALFYFTSGLQENKYAGKAQVELKINNSSGQKEQQNKIDKTDYIFQTECKKIESYPIVKKAYKKVFNTDLDEKNVTKAIQTKRIQGTNIIEISAVQNNPLKAAEFADSIAGIYLNKVNT
ncbi:MAG: hypothetical protein ACOC5R_01155, partial [Elusimicrobiota bacterium]